MSFRSASNNLTFSSVIGRSGSRGGPMVTPSIVNKCLAIVIGEPIIIYDNCYYGNTTNTYHVS